VQHLFKLLLEQTQLSGLVLHGRELPSNNLKQTRPQGRAWSSIETYDHCFDVTKRQAQRAGSSDEAQPLHAGLVVLSISGRRPSRDR
jgi:hypothetical protein